LIEEKYRTLIPSISEAKEMLWRGVLTLDDFKTVVGKKGFRGKV